MFLDFWEMAGGKEGLMPSCGTVKPLPWHCWLISHIAPKVAPGQISGGWQVEKVLCVWGAQDVVAGGS